MICRRYASAPLLTRDQIPDMPPEIIDATSVFNPGAVSVDGETCLLLRVQTRGRRTFLVPATSRDGAKFTVAQRPTELIGLEAGGLEVFHIYDPRITVLNDDTLVVTALDTEAGGRLGVWRAAGNPDAGFFGLDSLQWLGLATGLCAGDDTRNGVLFPEKIAGRFAMLHRPNMAQATGGPNSGSTIDLSYSDDLVNWDAGRPVFSGRPHFWDELIGSGPPPMKIEQGWLHLYHGIATHFQSVNIYQAGAVLLDARDPGRILARTPDNLLEPRELWECTGQVPNVVFPSGWVADKIDSEGLVLPESAVRIYYGAADTAVGRADTTVAKLLTGLVSV